MILPLLVAPNLVEIAVLPKLLAARVLLLGLALVLIGDQLWRGTLCWRFSPLDLPLLLFLVSAAASTILAVNTTVALHGLHARYQGLADLVSYFALFWLAAQTLRSRADAWLLIRSLVGGGYAVSLLAIVQVVAGRIPLLGLPLDPTSFRADATLGNPTILGAFLALLLPLALHELLQARSMTDRVIFANATIVIALGVTVSLTRSAWIGAAVGMVMVLISWRPRRAGMVVGVLGALVILGVSGSIVFSRIGGHITAPGPVQAVITRAESLAHPLQGTGGIRLHVWKDTMALIAARPVVGYGPDSFGMVYPAFQTGNWQPGVLFDRPHEEVLQVAATQGMISVAAYLLILGALLRAFWRGRHQHGAVALLAAIIAYEGPTQMNFSLASAEVPFLLFLAAAVTIWAGPGRPHTVRLTAPTLRIAGAAMVTAAAAVVAVLAIARPFAADAQYLVATEAWNNGDTTLARQAVADARALAPAESEYAILAGDLALDLDNNGTPAPDANYPAARRQYEDAVRLGTFSPEPFRELARTYRALGLRDQAIATAQKAVQLNRFDPANAAVLAEVSR